MMRPRPRCSHDLSEKINSLTSRKKSPSPALPPSEDGSECDGWRRELGADEVCENYMDAKFGGEDADMAESQRS